MTHDPDPPRLTTAIWEVRFAALKSAGFNDDDAERWARDPHNPNLDDLVAIAVDYRAHGFATDEAIRWRNQYTPPDVAARMSVRGWTPRQSVELQMRAFLNGVAVGPLPRPRGRHLAYTFDDWVGLDLSPEITLLYLRTRHTPPEAVELEARRANGEDVISALRVLYALQGND